ncbi:18754_t:CDS:2, partial [Entrophospora sp. SA101]
IENDKEKVSKFISWTLKGARGQVEQAIKYLNELLEQAVNACTGYLSIPQTYHRHIIGGGGSVISYIRRESQCVINMPEVNDDDTIVIIGSKENIVVAKDMIFEILINWRKEQNRYGMIIIVIISLTTGPLTTIELSEICCVFNDSSFAPDDLDDPDFNET